MLLTRRKQRSKTLLHDMGRAASRIADESRSAAGTARSELGGLGTEIRDQASESLTQARLATAAKLAGVAQTIEPEGKKKRRRLRFVIPAVLGGVFAAKVAKMRRQRAETEADELAEGPSPAGTEVAASTATSSKAVGSSTRDDANGKSRAKANATHSRSSTAGS
jgi:hypothetical protein